MLTSDQAQPLRLVNDEKKVTNTATAFPNTLLRGPRPEIDPMYTSPPSRMRHMRFILPGSALAVLR
jgi:hypothetical protein